MSFFTANQVNWVREDLLFTSEESVSLTWLQDAVFPLENPGNYTVDIWLYTLSRNTWRRMACLASTYPNSGNATVTIPLMEPSTTSRFSAVAVQVTLNMNQPEFFQNLTTAAGLWTVVAYATDTAPTREECNVWAEDTTSRSAEQNRIELTPPCPCTQRQALAPNSGFNEQNVDNAILMYFNPRAAMCFYQTTLGQ